jgi:hypothetical protein
VKHIITHHSVTREVTWCVKHVMTHHSVMYDVTEKVTPHHSVMCDVTRDGQWCHTTVITHHGWCCHFLSDGQWCHSTVINDRQPSVMVSLFVWWSVMTRKKWHLITGDAVTFLCDVTQRALWSRRLWNLDGYNLPTLFKLIPTEKVSDLDSH